MYVHTYVVCKYHGVGLQVSLQKHSANYYIYFFVFYDTREFGVGVAMNTFKSLGCGGYWLLALLWGDSPCGQKAVGWLPAAIVL